MAPSPIVETIPDPSSFEEVVVQDPPESRVRSHGERAKTLGKKPPRPQNLPLDEEMEDAEETGGDSGPELVGIHSVNRVAKIMSEIPSKED